MIEQVISLLEKGGVLMLPLTVLALLIYTEALALFFSILSHPVLKEGVDEGAKIKFETWLKKCLKKGIITDINSTKTIEQLRTDIEKKYSRRILMLARFVKSAPLIGLLGTVMGMFTTFQSLQLQGLAQAEDMAAGISQALITTQYGLLIAIPGMILLTAVKAYYKKLQVKIRMLHKDKASKKKSIKSSSLQFRAHQAAVATP